MSMSAVVVEEIIIVIRENSITPRTLDTED
jgi:hypothetical protein